MDDVFWIEEIENKIIEKKQDFIIYPFGNVGINVKDILQEIFGLIPCMIVDNIKSKTNKDIHNIEYLKSNYNDSMVILLTTYDYNLTRLLIEEIGFAKNNIVNPFISNESKVEKYEPEKFYLVNFFKAKEKEKVHISIIECSEFNSVLSFCQALMADNSIDLLLIIDGDNEKLINLVRNNDVPYIFRTQYSIKNFRPDIFILTHPYDRVTKMWEERIYAKKVVVIFSQLYDGLSEKYLKYNLKRNLEKYKPDLYIFDKYLYRYARDIEWLAHRCVEIGNPKFDEIYNQIEMAKINCFWKKLQGKQKVILWATDHGVCKDYICQDVTFDKYAENIFSFFMKHLELGLIFRPHPTFIAEMLALGYWTKNDIELLRKLCAESQNIVFDEEPSYSHSYAECDAIITDGFCGVTLSALPMNKPICLTFRNEELITKDTDLLSSYYIATDCDGLEKYLCMIKDEKDPLAEKRKTAINNNISHFDGKNGMRIKEFLLNGYFNDFFIS